MTHQGAGRTPLIVVGASARGLAASAARAGWAVHAADLFADADLRATAVQAARVPVGTGLPWPDGLEHVLHGFPIAPWIYSGALENHPDLVDRIARDRPLAGNAGAGLRAVRDPQCLAAAVRAAGLRFPETLAHPEAVPDDGSFVVKPRRGAGGRGVARWRGGPPPTSDVVWQRFVPGATRSVAYVIDTAGPRLFGASRQLVGRGWCGARGFAWCGAIDVPLRRLPGGLRARLERLGAVLGREFGLVGLVGADIMVDRAGEVHVLEVNPRPTASMELVERATGASVVATHLAACGIDAGPVGDGPRPPGREASWAKAVVYADRALVVTAAVDAALDAIDVRWKAADGGWPALADRPVVDSVIAARSPALTVFAAAGGAGAALRSLRGRVAAVRAILATAGVTPPGDAAARPPRPPPGHTA